MRTSRMISTSAGILAAALLLVACTDGPGDGDGGVSAGSEFNNQDVMFASMMIPHHEQAVEMSDMILAKDGIDPRVEELSRAIKAAQEPEIETMTAWLDEWDASSGMSGMDHGMNGMMSDDEMRDLEDATGDDASRRYLEQMTEHHEGAIDMAQTEIDSGEFPAAVDLAEDIVETQQVEIDQMQEMLATL